MRDFAVLHRDYNDKFFVIFKDPDDKFWSIHSGPFENRITASDVCAGLILLQNSRL